MVESGEARSVGVSKGQPGLPVVEEHSADGGDSHSTGAVIQLRGDMVSLLPGFTVFWLTHGLDVGYGRLREDLKGPGQLNSLVFMVARLLWCGPV